VKPVEVGRDTSLSQGALRLAGGVGYASSGDSNWLMLGAGALIQVLDGWEIGIGSKAWLSGDQVLFGFGPTTRYVFVQIPEIKPYIGVFHRFYPALTSAGASHGLGASLGVLFPVDEQLTLEGELAYEHLLEATLLGSEHQVYPELELSYSFDLLGNSGRIREK